MQPPGNHRDQNQLLTGTSALHWSSVIGNVTQMSFEIALCILDCPVCVCHRCYHNAALLHRDKNKFKRDCVFFHDSWRRPLIDVDVAIILFINTVYTLKLKVQQQLQQQFEF